MRIVGACIPLADIGYASELGMPVLGNLGEALTCCEEGQLRRGSRHQR